MTVELICGDCLDVMKSLPDGSVDAVVTDPPFVGLKGGYERDVQYGGVATAPNNRASVGDEWVASWDWLDAAWRVCRYGMLVFCSFHSIEGPITQLPNAKRMGLLTWYKRNAAPQGKNVPRYSTEFVWMLSKQPGLKWDAFKTTMFDIPFPPAGCFASERVLEEGTKRAAHPTQKPLELMIELLACNPASVLDPFMGTGTTGVACVQTGRNFIGIEIDPTYYAIAQKRIAEAQAQPALPLDSAARDRLSDEAMLNFEQGVETCNESNAT